MNKILIAFALVCLVSNVCVRAISLEQKKTASTLLLESVAEQDRLEFIKYQLSEGLAKQNDVYANMHLAQENEFENARAIDAPEDFSTNFLDWFQAQYQATETDVFNFVNYGLICFPSGTCVDPEDIGNICCPF